MRKIVLLFMVVMTVGLTASDDFLQNPVVYEPIEMQIRNAPQPTIEQQRHYEFVVDPTILGTTFYDYMPGGYNSTPIKLQSPAADGIYIAYTSRETAEATRRAWYAYVNQYGEIDISDRISTVERNEGFVSIDMHKQSGNPLVAWHRLMENNVDLAVVYSYDVYSMMQTPGLWMQPVEMIDPDESQHPNPAFEGNEFIWPVMFIGPSPEPGRQRVYVSADNAEDNPVTAGPSENVIIAYADFDESDLISQTDLDWNYTSVPLMDEWHLQGLRRPFKNMAVSDDGKVAYFGYNIILDGDENASPLDEELFVFVNHNYGEGEWEYHSIPSYFGLGETENPLNADGTPYFDLNDGEELYWGVFYSNHQNSLFYDDDSKLMTVHNMWLQASDENQVPTNSFYSYFGYPKVFIFDFDTDEFTFYNIGLVGDPDLYHNTPVLPWDPHGEGIEHDDDGYVIMENGYPVYYHDVEDAFHENKHKVAVNEDNGWLAAVWHDGLKNKYAFEGIAGYEDWAEVPETLIALSNDNGETWSGTISLNSNETPELFGMLPVYVYPSARIEDMGEGWGRMHLFFLDDHIFGSSVMGNGAPGAEIMYAAIDIDFHNPPPSQADDELIAKPVVLHQNYPNPFNPETTISFSMQQSESVSIEIFNIRGQKVKTLLNEQMPAGEHSVIWNGKNNAGQNVASGVYLYQISTDNHLSAKKMLLMK